MGINKGAGASIVLVFAGCCSSVVFLELLISGEPGSGSIITFAQFLFISLEGLVFTSRFGTKPNVIPIREYLVLVVMFFIVNVLNNVAFKFKISMPLHIIFRSGALITSLIMEWFVLGRKYSITKWLSVAMITTGTLLATMASAQLNNERGGTDGDIGIAGFLMGVMLLTLALIISALMGIFQERLYKKYGRHAREALFYIHMLSMPGFVLTHSIITEHIDKFNASEPLESMAILPVISNVPKMWIFLVANTLTHYICISSVFSLTTLCSNITVTLVLTLRKFLSLIFSVMYFMNPFTLSHWLGTVLVFSGTLLFSDHLKLWSGKGSDQEKVGKLREQEIHEGRGKEKNE